MNKISTSGFLKYPDFIFYFVKYIGQRASYTRTLINLLICVWVGGGGGGGGGGEGAGEKFRQHRFF